MTATLAFRGVTKRWRRMPEPVIDAVDLEVARGELLWLTGDNGAGKTTALRLAGGILAADAGSIAVCGFDLEDDARECKRRLGYLAAGNTGLYARLTARQQLAYASRLSFVAPERHDAAVAFGLDRFGLEALAGRRLDRMSMGERQRVRLATAFLHRPQLILLDEPRTSLDAHGMRLLAAVVGEHCAAGGAAVWVSPPNEPPEPTAARQLIVRGGRLEAA